MSEVEVGRISESRSERPVEAKEMETAYRLKGTTRVAKQARSFAEKVGDFNIRWLKHYM